MDNYVAKLNEYAQRQRLVLQFEEIGVAGPDHIKTFTLRAVLDGKAYPDGVGKNKKEARQNAAKNALAGLLEKPADITENAAEVSATSVHQTSTSNINYICWLNEYGQKNRVLVRPVETTRPGLNNQWCNFIVGDKEYPAASGKTRREAKEEAAKLVYHEICGSKSSETGDEKCVLTSSQQSEEIKQNVADVCNRTKSLTLRTEEKNFTESNFVGLVNHYCQKISCSHMFIEENICGPPHNRQFFYKLVIDNKEYPVGEGRSAKEAKQNAARLAWSALQEQSDWDSKITVRSAVSDDGAPAKLSTPPSTLDSGHPKSSSTNDSDVLSSSSSSFMEQIGDGKHGGSSSHQREEINQDHDDNCANTKIIKREGESFTEENFIGVINLYCQKTKHCHDYILVRKCGPPHNPQFFYKVVIDSKEYPVGEGKTVKEAKQHAAQQAWSVLQEQSNWDSKLTPLSGDVTPVQLSTPASTPTSPDAKSERIPTTTSDLVVSPKVPKPPKDQDPDLKPKRKIAANFDNASRNRKKDLHNSDFKEKRKEKKSSSENTSSTIVASRFTSEFDSIERLGKGAFGRVFKAKHKLLEKYYAIKIVRCKEKALREVSALSDLHHSHIVRYYTCWMEDFEYQWDSTADSYSTSQSTGDSSAKSLYIQMELCDTKTLRVWIDEKNTLNMKKSLRDSKRREDSLIIIQQIVSGVEYIHSKMFIHRDLKPANIMFGRDGEVKIGDFGLVTAEIEDDAENLLERSAYKGTPSYMAPEQKSKSHYDRKVDIFALGLIYFELLWNLSAGSERKVVWDNARSQKLPQGFLNNFPQEHQIIKAMLHAKPEDRPEASKLNEALKEYTHALYMQKNMFRSRNTV
ncbi:interferon-induced, double-stranded RNA-activated protein kinase-like isoform X2 [Archocentrus centrarchus]|uniref:interferon-induced, double-stranded RNA-activated protein kinase-like isoform X2 n=1 Tax=Archocentrus centrarchus TaxID=63155 RepID=UPI0011E9BCF3|nr:interferon-induced, double-stranded RNA-activated protein kinase-like isoform X2 [Archocentrus centrarchus]